MTKQSEVINNPNYVPVLDHGFCGLISTMGSDADIVSAARVSYGDGTKSVNEDRGLIRYLIRHKHTSPIEMAEVKLHLKMPIFVMRQWVRHRTASLNEYSGRYSIMTDEVYRPTGEALQPQSKTNKQGRDGTFTDREREGVEWLMNAAFEHSQNIYDVLVKSGEEFGDAERRKFDAPYDVYDEETGWLDDSYQGLTRELARTVLPVAGYTELYWKQDLHNLLHLIKLRRDVHAQREIRAFAEAVYQLIKPLFPLTIEAWEDYVWEARTLSRMEIAMLTDLLDGLPRTANGGADRLETMIAAAGGEKAYAEKLGMSLRELRETRTAWYL